MSGIVIALVCWIAILLAVVLFDSTATRRRIGGLKRMSEQLGFTFEPSARPFLNSNVTGLVALQQDESTAVADLMRGTSHGCEMLVFDLPCCAEFSVNVVLTTLAAFRCTRGRLPLFQVSAKGVVDRLYDAVAKTPHLIAFDEDFERHFSVHCASEAEARDYFTPERVDQLRAHGDGFHIESSPDWLLIFRPGVKVPPSQLPAFVEAASAVAVALLPPHSPQPVLLPAA